MIPECAYRVTNCTGLTPGSVIPRFDFDTNVDNANYFVICDLNGDGEFDPISNDDVRLEGSTVLGPNEVLWDGTDNLGDPVPTGTKLIK